MQTKLSDVVPQGSVLSPVLFTLFMLLFGKTNKMYFVSKARWKQSAAPFSYESQTKDKFDQISGNAYIKHSNISM